MNNPQYHPVSPFIERLSRLYPLVEIACVAVIITALYAQSDWRDDALRIALSTLAVVFYLRAFVPNKNIPEHQDRLDLFFYTLLPKVLAISCAMCLIGFLFYILHLHGATEMLLIGTLTVCIGVVLGGLAAIKSPPAFTSLLPLVARALAVASLGVYGLYRLGLFN